MSVDVATILTDYDWSNSSRPILIIAADMKSATLQIGTKEFAPTIEFAAVSVQDMKSQFEGFVELFEKAVEIVGANDLDQPRRSTVEG